MNWLAFLLAIGAIILFGWYAFTGLAKALGFGLVLLTLAWGVQLIVHTRGGVLSIH